MTTPDRPVLISDELHEAMQANRRAASLAVGAGATSAEERTNG